jgi:transposase-like protein
VSASVPSPEARDRSIEAKRSARLKKFERESLVIDHLNRGVSVAEIAMRLDVTEKRTRAIIREALAAHLPGPPEEFVALQISRLNEALLVASSAMSGQNLKAVALVVKIVRELDRYHGFFSAQRRSLRDPRPLALSEEEAEKPLALLVDGPGMAPQETEKVQSAPENDRIPNSSDEASVSLADPAQARRGPAAPQADRPEKAPQALEKAQFAPENAVYHPRGRGIQSSRPRRP